MEQSAQADVRRIHRRRVLKRGSILGSITTSEISCSIRNMHEAGAELKVPPYVPVPTTFLLYVATDGIAYQCEVRWREADRIGVAFTGTAPKPHWHYG